MIRFPDQHAHRVEYRAPVRGQWRALIVSDRGRSRVVSPWGSRRAAVLAALRSTTYSRPYAAIVSDLSRIRPEEHGEMVYLTPGALEP